jgi:hypothetical protein
VTVKSAFAGGAVPVPARELVCGEPAALSATLRVAVAELTAVGVNVIDVVQEEPAARVVPQVLVPILKEEAFAPLMPIDVIDSGALPGFVSVKVWAALLVPVVTLLKLVDAGVRAAMGAAGGADATPVPVNVEVCVPAASTTVRVAADEPALWGEKTTRTWQTVPAGRELISAGMVRPRAALRLPVRLTVGNELLAQVSATTMKLSGFVPLSEIDVIPSDVSPVFESVKVCAELALPVVTLPKSIDAGVSVACGGVITCAPFPERVTVRGDSGWLRSWTE